MTNENKIADPKAGQPDTPPKVATNTPNAPAAPKVEVKKDAPASAPLQEPKK